MKSHYRHLSAEDRGAIMAMSLQGCSARLIGWTLCRAPRSITRELQRNGYCPVPIKATWAGPESQEAMTLSGPACGPGASGGLHAGPASFARAVSCGRESAAFCSSSGHPSRSRYPQAGPSRTSRLASLSRNHLYRHLCQTQRRAAQRADLAAAAKPGGRAGREVAAPSQMNGACCRTC